MQTTLADKLFDRSQGNARYIDWTRGTSYTFTENDVNELISVKNTRYAFFRKAANVKVLESLRKNLELKKRRLTMLMLIL